MHQLYEKNELSFALLWVAIQAMTPPLPIEMRFDVRRLVFCKTLPIFLRVHIVIEGCSPVFKLKTT